MLLISMFFSYNGHYSKQFTYCIWFNIISATVLGGSFMHSMQQSGIIIPNITASYTRNIEKFILPARLGYSAYVIKPAYYFPPALGYLRERSTLIGNQISLGLATTTESILNNSTHQILHMHINLLKLRLISEFIPLSSFNYQRNLNEIP